VDFDRKKDFKNSFNGDRKSNQAPKKCRKLGEAVHGRAAVAGATHGRAGPGPCAVSLFFGLVNAVLLHFFRGSTETTLEQILGRKLGFSVASINSIRED